MTSDWPVSFISPQGFSLRAIWAKYLPFRPILVSGRIFFFVVDLVSFDVRLSPITSFLFYLMLAVCVLSYYVKKIYIKCSNHELSLLPI